MKPLFLLSPLNRSGTHFVRELLIKHPEISRGIFPEDYCLKASRYLIKYVEETSPHWYDPEGQAADRLLAKLRYILLDFFSQHDNVKYLLLITPRPWGICRVWELFPHAKILFLIRDGRDTVASACRSFSYFGFQKWVSEWIRGCNEIIRFINDNEDQLGKLIYVCRFEDFVNNPRAALWNVFFFLDLSPHDYPWGALNELPILGSGFERGGNTEVHWNPIKKTANFKPIGRYKNWKLWKRLYFKLKAGSVMREASKLAARSSLVIEGKKIDSDS